MPASTWAARSARGTSLVLAAIRHRLAIPTASAEPIATSSRPPLRRSGLDPMLCTSATGQAA